MTETTVTEATVTAITLWMVPFTCIFLHVLTMCLIKFHSR